MFRLITLTVLLATVALISANKPLHHPLAQERTNSVQPKAEGEYRLPTTTVPTYYDLTLTTNIQDEVFDFTGKVIISITVVTATNQIVLHSKGTTISTLVLRDATNAVIPTTFVYDLEKDFLIITTATQLAANALVKLDIDYTGVLRDDNAGFYRSSYTTSAGVVRWLATTQFESTDARHALPCYDEPHLKAVFKLTMKNGEAYHAISNMNIVSNTVITGVRTTIFAETKLMSSYLLAFIVSDFAPVTVASDPIQTVYAQPELVSKMGFSLNAGIEILKEFETYFGVPYGLPKLDQAAIPDFAAGAMENWGLVTYREEYLSYDEAVSSARQKELIATIIAHEYAHQWFGDLVSPEWWTFIWLNEGFATYYESFMADKVYPEMKLMDTYVTGVLQYSFGPDALDTTRIMSQDAQTPNEISGLFDNIAYDKSGCVIRMMHHALTEKVFVAGIKQYLTERSLKEANEGHLFTHLNTAAQAEGLLSAEFSVNTIFGSWSQQKGYPLLTVTRNYTTGEINLSQEKFLLKSVETTKSKWWLPYNFMSKTKNDATDTSPNGWMENVNEKLIKPSETPFGAINNNDWVIFNKQQTGYYRVQYDMDNWHLLMTALSEAKDTIDPINRAQLIDDSLNLARANREDYHVPFMVISYLKDETEYLPWAAASSGFTYLNRMFVKSAQYDQLQKLLLELVESLYTKIGIADKTGETHLDKYTRNIAINWACSLGHADCLEKTKTAVTEAVNNDKPISGNLRSVMYCNGLRSASEEIFTGLRNKLATTSDQNERTIIINALGCSQNETLLSSYLTSALEVDSAYRRQEKSRVISAVYNSGPAGVDATITFMKENAQKIVDTLNSRTLNSYVTAIASRVVTEAQKTAFNLLINDAIVKTFLTDSTLSSCTEIIADNDRWYTDSKASIESYLTSVYGGGASTVVVSVVAFVATLFITFNNLF